MSTPNDSMDDMREFRYPITAFPTTNRPILDTTMKDMLVSLRLSLHSDMMSCLRQFKVESVGAWRSGRVY